MHQQYKQSESITSCLNIHACYISKYRASKYHARRGTNHSNIRTYFCTFLLIVGCYQNTSRNSTMCIPLLEQKVLQFILMLPLVASYKNCCHWKQPEVAIQHGTKNRDQDWKQSRAIPLLVSKCHAIWFSFSHVWLSMLDYSRQYSSVFTKSLVHISGESTQFRFMFSLSGATH